MTFAIGLGLGLLAGTAFGGLVMGFLLSGKLAIREKLATP